MDSELDKLREIIDKVDAQILKLLARRMELVAAVGRYKRERGIRPLNPKRWREVIESRQAQARELGLAEALVGEILGVIHKYALMIERREDE